MECEVSKEYGRSCFKSTQRRIPAAYMREEHRVRATDFHLDFTCTVPEAGRRHHSDNVARKERHVQDEPLDLPLMSNMDEISYWIYTKRAPCLMTYDNLMKKAQDEAQCSKALSKSVSSAVQEVPSPKKKKKRKLSILDDDSASVEKQQNLYFDVSQEHNKNTVIISKSNSVGSDVDFNIKNSPSNTKVKKSKQAKTAHKKNNIVTSTPKVTSLRRSLRNTKQTLNHSHINSSFLINSNIVNGSNIKNNIEEHDTQKTTEVTSPILDTRNAVNSDSKKIVLNGQFDDMSDVSGLTANYIRSTRQQSNKTPRKLRAKNSKNLVKESNQKDEEEKPIVLEAQNATINCSTDSSNIINLDKTKNKSGSIKFESKSTNKNQKKVNLNISFQSTSRYPKRNRNPDSTKEITYNTRSARCTDNSALMNTNSTEKVSSKTSVNAPSPQEKRATKKKRTPKKTAPNRTVVTRQSERVKKDSLRDKSGFKACFSDSDTDSEPLQKRFFCS